MYMNYSAETSGKREATVNRTSDGMHAKVAELRKDIAALLRLAPAGERLLRELCAECSIDVKEVDVADAIERHFRDLPAGRKTHSRFRARITKCIPEAKKANKKAHDAKMAQLVEEKRLSYLSPPRVEEK